MRKSTFYGLAAFSGVCAMACAYAAWDKFFAVEGCACSRGESDFTAIGNAIKTYAINAGRPPSTGQGLAALVSEPKSGTKPRRWVQIMKKVPTDPWGTPYRYTLSAAAEREWCWKLRSAGPDGVFGSGDDISDENGLGGSFASWSVEEGEKMDSRPSY